MKISEHFYSIQGEGASVGVPAYFIRLSGCNLMCGGSNGVLMKEGKATWWCDSEKIWRNNKDVTEIELESYLLDAGIMTNVLNGLIHLVWTGGEPTLPIHQKSIISFLSYLNLKYINSKVYNEIETNGTILTENIFYSFIDQINCSPKLSNSGLKSESYINPKAIQQIIEHKNSYFKFVINREEDINEIRETYIKPFNIPLQKIIIMPGVDNRDDLPGRTAFIFEMTKKYGYRSITRQHILAWNKVTGV